MRIVSSLLLGTALVTAAAAQDPYNNWDRVQQIERGTKVEVELREGAGALGRLESATAEAIAVTTKDNKVWQAQKDEVKAVYMTVKGSRARSAGIGAIIGFIPGFIIGTAACAYIADQNSAPAGERIGVGMVMGAVTGGIGAGIGAAAGGSATKLVYRAPRRPKQG